MARKESKMVRACVVLMVAVHALSTCGCSPRATIRPNPGQHDKGLRFYRPKPYLLITPVDTTQTTKIDKESTTINVLSDRFVQIKLEYLPDFAEEYSITVRPGLGTNNTKITLDKGWNLTQLDQDLDSQFDENVKAIADLAKSVGAVATSKSSDEGRDVRPDVFVVPASNIPLGYYESVIGRDSCGRKQMYGWRYVGFAPFNGCPSVGRGSECLDCQTDLYGLVFRNGVMTFAPLAETTVASNIVERQQSQQVHNSTSSSETWMSLATSIQAGLKEKQVNATVSVDTAKNVIVKLDKPLLPGVETFVTNLANDIIREAVGPSAGYQVSVQAPQSL